MKRIILIVVLFTGVFLGGCRKADPPLAVTATPSTVVEPAREIAPTATLLPSSTPFPTATRMPSLTPLPPGSRFCPAKKP